MKYRPCSIIHLFYFIYIPPKHHTNKDKKNKSISFYIIKMQTLVKQHGSSKNLLRGPDHNNTISNNNSSNNNSTTNNNKQGDSSNNNNIGDNKGGDKKKKRWNRLLACTLREKLYV